MKDPRKELIEKLERIRDDYDDHGLSPLREEVLTLTETIETLKSQWDKLDGTPSYRGSHI